MKAVVSLFSGIGGFDLAARQAGYEVRLQVEIERYCLKVLRLRFPGTPLMEDVHEVRGRALGPVGVVCFGSPCQGLSVAGKQAGLADPRSGLFFEAARIIGECHPAFALWENVPGVLGTNAGRDFRAVLVALVELGARDIAWRVINARYAGVPQQRRRLFLVADFAGERAGQVLYQSEACGGHPRAGGAAGQDVARPLGASATGGRRGDLDTDTYIPEISAALHNGGRGNSSKGADYETYIPEVGHPLQAHAGKTQTLDADRMTYIFDETQVTSPGNYSAPTEDYSHALAAGARPPAVAFEAPMLALDDVAYTLSPSMARSQGNTAGKNGALINNVMRGIRVRFLTPIEQERLQGFPDGWTCVCGEEGDIWGCRCPDGPRNMALGNAVAVPVVRWILERLMEVV